MESKEYVSLSTSESLDNQSDCFESHLQSPQSTRCSRLVWLPSLLCIILTFSNAFLLVKEFHKSSIPIVGPQYSGVEQTAQLQAVLWTTEYSEYNSTEADKLWRELRAAFGVIALDHAWAADHGLPKSQDFQGDPSKGLYMIDAYHQIHCLQLLRTSLQEVAAGVPQSTPFEHKFHCLDSLRQSVICRADDTPLYTLGDFRSGDGQLRKCRDWQVLSRWATERFPFSNYHHS